jgi:TatD DNase family protein
MQIIDTHAHAYLEEFREDEVKLIEDAQAVGVDKVLLPNIDIDSISELKRLAANYPDFYLPMMGLHPCYVEENFEVQLNQVKEELDKRDYIAVGEIGIDLYWDKSNKEAQIIAFEKQLNWAKEINLPVAIHARESFDEIFQVLDKVNDDSLRGVLHCFTGNLDQANKIIAYGGFKLGVGGVVTFKNAGLDNVIKEISIEHLILETDSPYLSPHPKRGKRNEPSRIIHIASKLAEIKGIRIEEVAEVTTNTAKTLFNI